MSGLVERKDGRPVTSSDCVPNYMMQCTCGVGLYEWIGPSGRSIWMRHGENDEHVREFTAWDMVNLNDPLNEWVEGIHEYERSAISPGIAS